jgi:hypothetical protein
MFQRFAESPFGFKRRGHVKMTLSPLRRHRQSSPDCGLALIQAVLFFLEIPGDGQLHLCLSAPPYYQQLNGKYFDWALYLEDGTRIEIKAQGRRQLAIFSPPDRLAATLTASADAAGASQCIVSGHDAAKKVGRL